MINKPKLVTLQKPVMYFVVGALAFLLLQSCGGQSDKEKAARLLEEINQILATKERSISDLPESVKNNLSQENIERFPSSRAILETATKEALPYYIYDLEKFNSIANKFEEIEKLNLNHEYLASVSIQKQLYRNYIKGIELQKSRLELVLDKNIKDKEILMIKAKTIELQINEVKKEISVLEKSSNKDQSFINE